MQVICFVLIFSFVLVLILYLGGIFLSVKKGSNKNFQSFESGFESVGKIQNAFSIHFFVLMLLFVIFDLEVIMLLGMIMSSSYIFLALMIIMVFFFGGFYLEWFFGKMLWLV